MRRHVTIAIGLFALITLGLVSRPALAMGHVTLGSHSTGDIKKHCDSAGGSYYNSGGVYGCFGPGGDVTCSGKTGKCFGSCTNCAAAMPGGKGGPKGVSGILTVAPAGSLQTKTDKNLKPGNNLTSGASNKLTIQNSTLTHNSTGGGSSLMKKDLGSSLKH